MNESFQLSKGLKWSLIGHLTLILLVLTKTVIFPDQVKPYIPTLKVDLVALPDVLKKDLTSPTRSQFTKEISQLMKKVEQEAHKSSPDEMTIPKKKEKEKEKEKEVKPGKEHNLTRHNLRALERIKSLSKIQNLEKGDDDTPSQAKPIKGNKLSPGTSISGEAREASEANYFDIVRDRLRENWALPPWVARQNLSAQIKIYINTHGQLQQFQFLKPSGNGQFDEAVKRAIQDSTPYPLPPKEIASTLLSNGILVGFPL